MLTTKLTLLIYFFICVTATFFLFKVKNKQRWIVSFLLYSIGIVLVTFRGKLGIDTANYLAFINSVDVRNLNKYYLFFEPFFIYTVLLAKFILFDLRFVLLFIALLSMLPKFYTIEKNSSYSLLSLLIFLSSYFLPLEFNQIRQGLSLGIFLLSLDFLFRRCYFKYYILIIIGCLFHSSLLLCLFFPLIPRKSNTTVIIGAVFISFIFVFVSIPLGRIVSLISQFGPKFVGDKLLYYIISKYADKVGFSIVQLWYLILVCVSCYYIKYVDNKRYNFYLNIFVVGVSLNYLFNSVSVLLRLTYPLLFVEIFIPPLIIIKSKNKEILFCLFVLFYIIRFLNVLNGFK